MPGAQDALFATRCRPTGIAASRETNGVVIAGAIVAAAGGAGDAQPFAARPIEA